MSGFTKRVELLEVIKNGNKTFFTKTFEGNRTLGFIRTTKDKFELLKIRATRFECLHTTMKKGITRHYQTCVEEYEVRYLCGRSSFTI